jgi:hypothetical protein
VARKRRGADELPLDDPRWLPLDVPHGLLIQRTGNDELANRDLTALLAKPVKGLRSMVRLWPGKERKLLSFKYWTEHYVSRSSFGRLRVFPGRASPVGPMGPIHEDVHYVWKPDLEKIWPSTPPPGAAEMSLPRIYVLLREIAADLWPHGYEHVATRDLIKYVGDELQRRHLSRHLAVPKRDVFLRAFGRRKD